MTSPSSIRGCALVPFAAALGCAAAPVTPCGPGFERRGGLCYLVDDGGSGAAGGGDAGADTGGADAGPGAAPVWSVTEVESVFDAAFADGIPDPLRVRGVYGQAIAHAEPACPARESQSAGTLSGVWFADCVTRAGAHFDGLGIVLEAHDDAVWDLDGVANFIITLPDGRRFDGGGEFALDARVGGGALRWSTKTGGVYHFDGETDWIGAGGEVALFAEGVDAGGARSVRVDGGAVMAGHTLAFRDLRAESDVCDGLPSGQVLVRDPGTHWWSVDFGGCAPCGVLHFHGEATPRGELCIGPAVGAAALALHDVGLVP